MRPERLVLKPEKLVLKKPTVEDLDRILNSDVEPTFVSVRGELIEALPITDLRACPGGWMDNVAAGRRLAVTRRGKVLALLVPPPPDTKLLLTMEELQNTL